MWMKMVCHMHAACGAYEMNFVQYHLSMLISNVFLCFFFPQPCCIHKSCILSFIIFFGKNISKCEASDVEISQCFRETSSMLSNIRFNTLDKLAQYSSKKMSK